MRFRVLGLPIALFAAVTVLPSRCALGGFDEVVQTFACVPMMEFTASFKYVNNSRSIEIMYDPGPTGEQGGGARCRISVYTREPIKPRFRTEVSLKCEGHPTQAGSFVRRCAKIGIQRRIEGTGQLTDGSETLCIQGNYGKECGAIPQAILPLQAAAVKKRDPEAECPSVRHDLPPSKFAQVAVRNQQQLGACYASVATAMYDYMRAEDGLPILDQTSTLASALDYKSNLDARIDKGARVLDGGFDSKLIELLVKDGGCPDSGVRRRMAASDATEDELNALYGAFTGGVASLASKLQAASAAERALADAAIEKCLGEFKQEVRKKVGGIEGCKTAGFINLTDILVRSAPMLACGDTLGFLRQKLRITCEETERTHLRRKWKVKETFFSQDDVTAKLRFFEKQFVQSADKRPMAVDVKSCFIQGAPEDVFPAVHARSVGQCRAGHAMIVAGQAWNPKLERCEVILRNSWGKEGCGFYRAWDCNPSRGTFSVDKEVFLQSAFGFTTVHPAL